MKKTILVPTDFHIESLNVLKQAMQRNPDDEVTVVLLHGRLLSNSIVDLLFYDAEKIIAELTPPSFTEALSILSNRFSKSLAEIRKELFHGINNQNAFQNFLTANKIEEAYIPKKYPLKNYGKSFDLLPYIRKSKLSVHEMEWDLTRTISESDQLNALFA